MTDNHENILISGLHKGSEEAFTRLYHLYVSELYLYANNVLKDPTAAEDIVQELFISIWNSREQLQIHTSLKAYLYTANRYLILKTIRNREKEEQLFEHLEQKIWGSADIENELYRKELDHRIAALTAELPDKCREIYLLSREHQLSNKEIADKLGISVKTVENQMTIALRKLRKGMGYLLAICFPY